MEVDLKRAIEVISKEKGIERELVIEAIEEAMEAAARKTYGMELNLEAKYNPEIGHVEVFQIKTVVAEVDDDDAEIGLGKARTELDPGAEIGDEVLLKLDASPFGRIAAQAAKQNIVQKVRDYERTMIYNEFKEHEGTIQSGVVMRFERGSIIVQLRPNVDAILPESEQIPRERYRQGDRLRALIVAVSESVRGPQIVLSRRSPDLVKRLFEQEVPEVYEGIVEIKKVVRKEGVRAKIAVVSNDSDVDPVGACVGMRGSRVQAVVQELRGERIDIVPWTPDETEFVCRALSPAKVSRIVIDDEAHTMEVIVPDDQLSLAIGRKGQNVQLAAELTGWKLDCTSDADYERKVQESRRSLCRVDGLGDFRAELLLADGYKSAREVAGTEPASISAALDIPAEEAEAIVSAAAIAAEKERLDRMVLNVAYGVSDAAYALRALAAAEAAASAEDGEAGTDEAAPGETTAPADVSAASGDVASAETAAAVADTDGEKPAGAEG